MSWSHYHVPGPSQPGDFSSSFLGTSANTSNNGEPPSYGTSPAVNPFNLMHGLAVAGTGPELDPHASTSYYPRTGDPLYLSGHVPGAPYEPRSILPTPVTHPSDVHSNRRGFIDSSSFAPQPTTRSGNTPTWPNTMAPVPYLAPADPPSIGPQMQQWSSAPTHRASVASGSRTTTYLVSSPVLSTVPDYTLEDGFKFRVMARDLSIEPAELKEWKPEHSWDYTICIEGLSTQMGAEILINLNNPTNIPTGSLGLWFYMKKDGSDNRIEGPTCGSCAKRQLTNVVRFRDAITAVQAHTRIICSPPETWLKPLPDNTAYVADVSFLIWCPAYHEARSDHNPARVKQPRQHFQLVCELRDHSGRALATTVLRRTWGGDKRSRQLKKDADRRSGHRASISGELATPHVDSHALPTSHAHLSSPGSDIRTPLLPPSHLLPIKVEASSPTHTTSPHIDLLSSPRVERRSRGHVKAVPASETRITSPLPAVPPLIRSSEVAVIEVVDGPSPSDSVVEIPGPPVAIYVGSSSPPPRRAPAPSPESPGRTIPRCVLSLGPRIIAPQPPESVIEMVRPRADFLGVWREEGRANDEVQLTGAGFNRETEYFAQFGKAPLVQAFYRASNILTCNVPDSETMGIVTVSIVSRDGSMVLCEQQRWFRYLSDQRFNALKLIMTALDSADEEDIQGEAAEFKRRLLSKKEERRSLNEGHKFNPGHQPQVPGATAMVNSPVPFDHDPLLSSQPSPVNDDQTLSRSRSSTLVSPSAHSYSFHEIKSLGVDPSSWDRVRSWFERKDSTTAKGRKRSAEEMEDDKTLERGRVSEGLTLVESLAAKVAGSPRVRDQDAHKMSREAQPRLKKQRLNDELCR